MNNLFKFVKGHIRILWSLMWVQILQENRYVARIDEYSEIDYDASEFQSTAEHVEFCWKLPRPLGKAKY